MSQENLGAKAFVAGENLEAYRRVKLSAGSGTQVEYADAGEAFIGITAAKVDLGEYVSVNLRSSARTYKVEAAEALGVGATLYGAIDGKVADTASGTPIGTALEAAAGDGEIIEAAMDNGSASALDGASVAIEPEGANGAIPVIFRKTGITDASTAVTIVTAPFKFLILDWWLVSRDVTAANVKLVNVATDASGNVAKGTTDDAIVRGGDVIAEQDEVLVGSALKVEASLAAAFDVFVKAIRIS